MAYKENLTNIYKMGNNDNILMFAKFILLLVLVCMNYVFIHTL